MLETNVWKQIFTEGAFPVARINEGLSSSEHFQSESAPNWVKLWHGRDLDDGSFRSLLSTVMHEWDDGKFTHEGQVLHVMGMLLEYGKDGLHRRSGAQLLKQGRRFIRRLSDDGILVPSHDPLRSFARDSYAGLGFMGLGISEFRELQDFLDEDLRAIEQRALPGLAEMLIQKLDEGAQQFYVELVQNQQRKMSGALQPVLASLDAGKFVDKVLTMGGTDM